MEFVQDRAAVANTYFGQMIASKMEGPKDDKVRRRGPLYPHGNATMATVTGDVLQPRNEGTKRTFTCVQCAGGHHLERQGRQLNPGTIRTA